MAEYRSDCFACCILRPHRFHDTYDTAEMHDLTNLPADREGTGFRGDPPVTECCGANPDGPCKPGCVNAAVDLDLCPDCGHHVDGHDRRAEDGDCQSCAEGQPCYNPAEPSDPEDAYLRMELDRG